MKIMKMFTQMLAIALIMLMAMPPGSFSQEAGEKTIFKQEELEQILAPIALYSDSLLSQILIASTYPLDVVQADRWAKKNKDIKGDALTNALEKEEWDPSVKSLVNFPQVLDMMSQKLDWTQKLGDAFLAQQKDVMDTVQKLRWKAEEQGNLKSSQEQKVVVEKETKTIIIEPANPQVIYVPTYNPTVVYGAWAYPAYPPYYYYPPGYVAGAALFSFGVGLAVGAAWGYAWGGCNWRGGNVDINVNRNTNINQNINRSRYQQQWQQKGQIDRSGRGTWQHNPAQRKGVAYRDSSTAQKFGQTSARPAASSRDARGFGESRAAGAQTRDFGGARGGTGQVGGRASAFSGAGNGSFERSASQRGQASRSQSFSGGGSGSRSSGSFGGASRGGGGFSGGARGGGARGGGGRR
jgi:Protein of unknown function (DUF3300)